MPRLKSETIGAGDQSWLGSDHGIYNCRSGNLDISAFTAETHYPDGFLLSGTPLGRITTAGATLDKYGPFDADATDGTEVLAGFLYTDQSTDGVEDINVPIFDHGKVKLDKLPIAVDVADLPASIIAVGTGA
jgi:hypothetical protein